MVDPGARSRSAARARRTVVSLYLLSIVVTAAYHVPRNDQLALLDANQSGADTAWAAYAAGWTTWNHVRTVTCLAATALLASALQGG